MTLTKEKAVWRSLCDPEYRRQWANEHVGVGLAFQIRALREARGWNQAQLGERTGKAQETLSQCENPNYGRYTLSTLKRLAEAFDVGLLVRFVPFSELIDWTVHLTQQRLAPPSFDEEYETTMASMPQQETTIVTTPSGDVVVPVADAHLWWSAAEVLSEKDLEQLLENARLKWDNSAGFPSPLTPPKKDDKLTASTSIGIFSTAA